MIQHFADILSPPASLDARIFEGLTEAMPQLVSPRTDTARAAVASEIAAKLRKDNPRGDRQALDCLEAALLLWADDLHAAHELCQNVPTSLGSAWHAVMHRREPDFFNSNYWWRRATGITWSTPSGTPLAQRISTALAQVNHPAIKSFCQTTTYEPSRFVNLVEQCHEEPALQPALQTIQRLEWGTLFLTTYGQIQPA